MEKEYAVLEAELEAVHTYNTYGDGRLNVDVAAVVTKQLHQTICTHTSTGTEKLCCGLCHWHIAAFLAIV